MKHLETCNASIVWLICANAGKRDDDRYRDYRRRAGERFIQAGGSGNKLNALLQGKTVFEHTLQQALASGLPVQVVTRPENLPVQQVCAAYQVPCTLLASGGLGESIAAGVAATANWNGWLIHLADMPFVSPQIFVQVAAALSQHNIVRPSFQHQPGHPVGFTAILRKQLCALHGDNGARAATQSRGGLPTPSRPTGHRARYRSPFPASSE